MFEALITGAALLLVVGLAAAALYFKERFEKPLALMANAFWQSARPAVLTTLALIVCVVIVSEVSENWGAIVCWTNDETGSLGRTCAMHKIASLPGYDGVVLVEVTGIADIGYNLKRVEFRWRPTPNGKQRNSQPADGSITFRKYDDGWRPSE